MPKIHLRSIVMQHPASPHSVHIVLRAFEYSDIRLTISRGEKTSSLRFAYFGSAEDRLESALAHFTDEGYQVTTDNQASYPSVKDYFKIPSLHSSILDAIKRRYPLGSRLRIIESPFHVFQDREGILVDITPEGDLCLDHPSNVFAFDQYTFIKV